ncbi:MAG TPA: hypothetical protein PK297_13895 [Spirochaetota bacterium]|nr:hypothetical protein [Spirochaetota bacterium]
MVVPCSLKVLRRLPDGNRAETRSNARSADLGRDARINAPSRDMTQSTHESGFRKILAQVSRQPQACRCEREQGLYL